MTDTSDTSADSTRRQILRAACHQFAHRSYSKVSLDDILADARVTKGAMYFHFRSKHALAMAIIELHSRVIRGAANDLLARKLSGMESLVDISYLIAANDVSQDLSRAALHLLESIGRADNLRADLLRDWVKAFAVVVQRAIADGDVMDHCDSVDVSHMLIALYAGTRQLGNLDDPHEYFDDLEKSWLLVLPGFAAPERIDYLTKFIKRRTALAKAKAAAAVNVNPA